MIGHVIHGRGPRRVIALHGWFGDHRIYDPMLSGFDEDEYSFALLDQRGYGLSRDQGGPANVDAVARDAASLADDLGWTRFFVIGHSMGGKVALRLAANCPDRIEAVVAITPVWAAAAPFDTDTLALFRAAAANPDAREGIIRHSTSGRLPDAWYARLVRDSFATATQEAFAGYFESWALDDFAVEARALTLPVLTIVGAHDQAITTQVIEATWLDGLAAARMQVITEAGHYPMQETPLTLAGLVTDFLADASGGHVDLQKSTAEYMK